MRHILLPVAFLLFLCAGATLPARLAALQPAEAFTWEVSPAPVLRSGAPVYWDQSPQDPSVVKDGDVYYMYYGGSIQLPTESYSVIAVATSYDGRHWTKMDGFNIVMNRTPGTWDSPYGPGAPSVLKDGGVYKMWYHVAAGTVPLRASIGYATSTDGIQWTKHPGPVLSPGSFPWESNSVTHPLVIKDGQMYRMYYVANYEYPGGGLGLAMATSADGIHWTKHPSLIYQHDPRYSGMQSPTVVRMLGQWHMWYSFGSASIYYATSPDGISWTQVRQEAALNVNQNGCSSASRPTALADETDVWLWFNMCYGIGYARSGYPSPTETSTPTVTPTREGTPIAYQTAIFLPVIVKNSPAPTPTPTRTAVPSPVASNWVHVFADDFEGPFLATPGKWQVVQQGGKGYGQHTWSSDMCRVYRGGFSAWAVAAGDPPMYCGAPYDNGLENWLIARMPGLQGYSAAELRFQMWLNSEPGSDGLCALASRDGVWFRGSCLSGRTNGQWVAPVLDLGNLLDTPALWIAFVFLSDDANTRSEGVYLDNVQVRGCAAASCPRPGSSPVTMQEATGLSIWNIVRHIPSSTE